MTKRIIDSTTDALTEQLTGEVLNQKFDTEMGQKAVVQRDQVKESQHKDQLRLVLEDIGKDIQNLGEVPKGMEYCGSAAVHIYRAGNLKMFALYNQFNLSKCPEDLAARAVIDLKNATIEVYGHKAPRKRSGF